uniref:Uncharacterized protein n=1 Tax=Zea mays TaxID=4577 RepID=C0P4A4_MAIZE|nr:unknown [Zea mays]
MTFHREDNPLGPSFLLLVFAEPHTSHNFCLAEQTSECLIPLLIASLFWAFKVCSCLAKRANPARLGWQGCLSLDAFRAPFSLCTMFWQQEICQNVNYMRRTALKKEKFCPLTMTCGSPICSSTWRRRRAYCGRTRRRL